MQPDDVRAGGLRPPPDPLHEAQVAAFEALREVLSPERWEDAEELARAAFLAGWHARPAMQGITTRRNAE
jgi:hypothetical protein